MGTSILAEAAPPVRPPGVRVIALVCLAFAAYLGVNGALVIFGVVSFASGAYFLGELTNMGPLIYFLVAAFLGGVGFALLRRWRWSRRVALLAAALLFAGAVMPVSSAVIDARILDIAFEGAKIVVAVIAVRYLLQPEVVDFFSAKSG